MLFHNPSGIYYILVIFMHEYNYMNEYNYIYEFPKF